MVSEVDPVEFGAVKAEVAMLRREQAEMRADIRELVALANRGKGAYWAGMFVASGIGAVVGIILKAVFR